MVRGCRGCACLGLRTALATPARWSAEASGDERAALSSAALVSEYVREYVSKSSCTMHVLCICAMHVCYGIMHLPCTMHMSCAMHVHVHVPCPCPCTMCHACAMSMSMFHVP